MRATLSLGRWAGVPVGANVGVLVILLLIGFGLGAWHFPTVYPDEPVWAYAVAGAAAALLLVAAFIDEVVLHQPYSTYPLVDADGRLSGLVTLNRIRRVPQPQRATTRLSDIACPPPEVPTAGDYPPGRTSG
jgi:hypothetical protein